MCSFNCINLYIWKTRKKKGKANYIKLTSFIKTSLSCVEVFDATAIDFIYYMAKCLEEFEEGK
jgi:hypothetical protein